MKLKFIVALLFTLSISKLFAGWYECYNFSGYIDKYPVTFCIQLLRDGYFGEADKKDYNILGVYKYDKHNHPIRLEGKIDLKTNKARIFELSGEKNSAVFEFDFTKGKCEGIWTSLDNNTSLPLKLNYVSMLVDTFNNTASFDDVEILMLQSLPQYYFVGIYEAYESKSQMNKLKIIHKKTNKLVQTIDLSNNDDAGRIMTIIYDNLRIDDSDKLQLYIMCDIGRVGGFYILNYNKNTGKFTLDPKPVAEGV